MKTLSRILSLAVLLTMALSFAACSSDDDIEKVSEPSLKVGDTVSDFQRAKPTDNTAQFQSDLDAFCTYALDIQAVRMAWCMLLSKGFETEEMWCSTYDDIEGNVGTLIAEFIFDVIDDVVENAEEYEVAINSLADKGVLEKPNQTRGWIASGANFIYNCRNTQVLGRKSVVAILSHSNMSTDTRKLKELFDLLPSNLREGYTDYALFWNHFSAGKLDARANQVFVNLYTFDAADFGEEARRLKITPGGNITAAGAKLIESGANLVISSLPCANEVGYGVDLYNSVNAASELITKGNVKGFVQTALNNAVNYGPYLQNYFQNGKWEGLDLFNEDEWDLALIQEAISSCLNDGIFTDTFQETFNTGYGERLIPNLVTAHDKNGEEVVLVCMLDQRTGRLTVGFSIDSDGNVVVNPKVPGTQTLTAVDRKGRRVTKTVVVPEDEPLDVEVEFMDEGLEMLEEYPKNGDLSLRPSSIGFSDLGGVYYTNIVTNYLYYTCKSEDKWLSASIPTDMNRLNVTCAAYDGKEDRTGHVIVAATDSKGKVLKTVVLNVLQKAKVPTEYWVSTSPSELEFDVDGGTLETVVDHSYAYNHIGALLSADLAGWADYKWKETSTGWNIVVDAKPNGTGQERSGTITVFAAYSAEALNNALDGNIDPDLVASTTLLVKQQGTTGTGEMAGKFELGVLNMSIKCKFNDGNGVDYHRFFQYGERYNPFKQYIEFSSVSHNPTTTKSGTTIIFNLNQHYEHVAEYQVWRWSVTDNQLVVKMTASNPNDITTYKITSVTANYDLREYDYYQRSSLEEQIKEGVELSANIPYTKTTQENGYKGYVFTLKEAAAGKAVKSWTFYWKNSGSSSFVSSQDNSDDNITITLYSRD